MTPGIFPNFHIRIKVKCNSKFELAKILALVFTFIITNNQNGIRKKNSIKEIDGYREKYFNKILKSEGHGMLIYDCPHYSSLSGTYIYDSQLVVYSILKDGI